MSYNRLEHRPRHVYKNFDQTFTLLLNDELCPVCNSKLIFNVKDMEISFSQKEITFEGFYFCEPCGKDTVPPLEVIPGYRRVKKPVVTES
jgi:uncharacterized protein with PIN domain